MARTKEFDPDEVLDEAMALFWCQGYEATSTADLVEHLGIARASLYATFGSKHELYLRALDRYRERTDQAVLEALSRPGNALPAVRSLVGNYADAVLGDPVRRGCLVVNAAVERMAFDDSVAYRIESSWTGIEVALHSALLRAWAQGELRADADPRALARFLLVFLQGIRVLGRGRPDRDRIQDAVRTALSLLD